MSAMLGKTVPGHSQPCVRASHGCTCYYFPGEYRTRARSTTAKRIRRRAARRREERDWRADFDGQVRA